MATPLIADPNFERAVVLLLGHEDEGAAGVILNRPSELELEAALPDWASLAAQPRVVFGGGPVNPGAAVCLARADGAPDGWEPVIGPLGVFDLAREARDGLDRLRIFSGYAGWGQGQLEAEIATGAWLVLDADPDDALTTEPRSLWRFVLRRTGGNAALLANYPDDPSHN